MQAGPSSRTLCVSLVVFVVLAAPGLYVLVAPQPAAQEDAQSLAAKTQRAHLHLRTGSYRTPPSAHTARAQQLEVNGQSQVASETHQHQQHAVQPKQQQSETENGKNKPRQDDKIHVVTKNGSYYMRKAVRTCRAWGGPRAAVLASAARKKQSDNSASLDLIYIGCMDMAKELAARDVKGAGIASKAKSWDMCGSSCARRESDMFAFLDDRKLNCLCLDMAWLPSEASACAEKQAHPQDTETCASSKCTSHAGFLHLYHLGSYPRRRFVAVKAAEHRTRYGTVPAPRGERQHVDVYSFIHPRLGSLWHTCRFTNYSSRFDYHLYDMRFQLSEDIIVHDILQARKGPKIILLNSCCSKPELLLNWPDEAVLVIAGDESARWGFAHPNGRNWWGPHGNRGPLPSDRNHNMILPSKTNPWFRQYFSQRHIRVYGNSVHFLPLGSRTEFQDPQATIVPSTTRRYIYSFMGAATNRARRYLVDVMQQDTLIPKDKAFLHLIDSWAADPNDPQTGYINSTTYATIMQDSIFTMCPRGNSVEQYRIYEALEVGSIPVICLEDGYTRGHLLPEMMSSPIVFVEDWKHAPARLMELYKNPSALLKRQMDLVNWYDSYLRKRILDIEHVLKLKSNAGQQSRPRNK